jgi:hypothetical protein
MCFPGPELVFFMNMVENHADELEDVLPTTFRVAMW